jgi:hypothetical protein
VVFSWKVRVRLVLSSDPSCYRQQSWRASIIYLSMTASNLARRRYKSSGTPFCFRLVGILVLRPHLSMCLNYFLVAWQQRPSKSKSCSVLSMTRNCSRLLNQKLLSGYRNWVGHPDRLPILTVVRRAMEPV